MSTYRGGCILRTFLGVASEDKAVFIILSSLRPIELWQQLNLGFPADFTEQCFDCLIHHTEPPHWIHQCLNSLGCSNILQNPWNKSNRSNGDVLTTTWHWEVIQTLMSPAGHKTEPSLKTNITHLWLFTQQVSWCTSTFYLKCLSL